MPTKMNMKINLLPALALSIIISCVAVGQDSFSGTWKGKAQGRGGRTQEVTLTLNIDGSSATGAITRGESKVSITEGSVDGSTIKFQSTINRRGNELTISYSGKLDGDQLALNMTPELGRGRGGRGSRSLVLTRQD